MGNPVVSVIFRNEVSSILKEEYLKLTCIVKKFEVFDVVDAISVHFPKDFVVSSNTINSVTQERAMDYNFRRAHCSFVLQKHFRMTPKEYKRFNIFVFVKVVYFFNRFGVSRTANVQQELNS